MQVGTPDEVYAHPQNTFVRALSASPTSFPVRSGTVVLTADGVSVPVSLRRPYEGSALLSARPEQLFFSAEGLRGTISLSTFLGDFIEYEITLQNGRNVQLNEYTKDVSGIRPDGEAVHLSFDPGKSASTRRTAGRCSHARTAALRILVACELFIILSLLLFIIYPFSSLVTRSVFSAKEEGFTLYNFIRFSQNPTTIPRSSAALWFCVSAMLTTTVIGVPLAYS